MPVKPRLRRHLVHPALGDPPLGVDFVVIEDHRRRDRGQQPADDRLAPRLVIGQRVFAEVGDLIIRHVAGTRAVRDHRPQRGRRLVGVDLVAEHQQHVREHRRAAFTRGSQRVGPQRVDPLAVGMLVGTQNVGWFVWERDTARAEDHPRLGVAGRKADRARRERGVGRRPDLIAVVRDLVGMVGSGGQAVDCDKREMQAVDAQGARTPAEDLDVHAASVCSQIVATSESAYRTMGPRTSAGTRRAYIAGGPPASDLAVARVADRVQGERDQSGGNDPQQ